MHLQKTLNHGSIAVRREQELCSSMFSLRLAFREKFTSGELFLHFSFDRLITRQCPLLPSDIKQIGTLVESTLTGNLAWKRWVLVCYVILFMAAVKMLLHEGDLFAGDYGVTLPSPILWMEIVFVCTWAHFIPVPFLIISFSHLCVQVIHLFKIFWINMGDWQRRTFFSIDWWQCFQ